MPSFGFLNRNNKNADKSSASTDKKSAATAADLVVHLPPMEARRLVRDRVLTAAASVYIRYGVNASMDLDEDKDLSKNQKAQKRNDQYAAQESYKSRLKAVLGSQALSPVLATCLLLDAKDDQSPASDMKLSMHDAFACVSLLLCNYVILTATTSKDKKLKDEETTVGYDARVRNVLRMASIQLLTESLQHDDEGGVLLQKLKEQRQPRPKVKTGGENGEEDGENVETQLGDILDEEIKKKQEEESDEKEKDALAEYAHPDGSHIAVYSNMYRQYATRKFQALEQSVADLMMREMVKNASKPGSDGRAKAGEEQSAEDSGGRFSRKSMVRAAKIGGVGVAAGALFAVTGGLAAPGIAAGLAAIGVGGTALTLAASPAALIALFGVGGGGLSAYKMKRRTDELSEFIIHQETADGSEDTSDEAADAPAHLHTTVCISGWLTDEMDFQRPWGVTPSNLTRLEKLERFFSVFDPEKVKDAEELLKPYTGNKDDSSKDEEQWQAFSAAMKEQYGSSPDALLPLKERAASLSEEEDATLKEIVGTILHGDKKDNNKTPTGSITISSTPVPVQSEQNVESNLLRQSSKEEKDTSIRVWDYQTEYGGDLYTIQWETPMLLKMCRVADNLIKELRNKATAEVLKRTALATIMSAVALPSLLMGLAGSLDNDWSLISIRSDLAGKELAKSLLESNERRPVNLVSYSFGARIVYACLLELARHQAIWEQEQKEKENGTFKKKSKSKSDDDSIIEYTREPASIVQDAIIMGAPIFVSRSKLRVASHMVAGRFVNCYSRKDWILSLMFQYQNTSGIMRGTCGTGPIQGVSGIENFDVSSLVYSWHANYCRVVPDILDMVGFDQPIPTDPEIE